MINSGDTAWVLASAALVLLMTPGLAFFYGGMVRSKNVLAMLMQNYVTIGIVSVLWILVMYSMCFGNSMLGGFVGNFHFAGFNHMMAQPVPGETLTIPPAAFSVFQLMFAVITPALFTGSIADRMKFSSFIVIVTAWSLLVYAPIAHWVFSPEGWLFQKGAEDFAGGTVVHANAGAAGLALAIVLGKRRGWPKEQTRPHNIPFVLLGAALLWFGWFGFNAGSALESHDNLATYAFINTNTATAAALLGWLIAEKIRDGHATTLGAASGAVAGLVAITPAAGFVSPMGSILLGLIAGFVCCFATALKFIFKFDDALDVVGVHLVGGVLGALLIGFLGTSIVNSIGLNGIFYGGGATLLGKQALDVACTVGYSFCATLVIGYIVKYTMGIRVSDDVELQGLDINLHAETAYEFTTSLGGGHAIGAHAAERSERVEA
jgi:Amt family ammonium transporter